MTIIIKDRYKKIRYNDWKEMKELVKRLLQKNYTYPERGQLLKLQSLIQYCEWVIND